MTKHFRIKCLICFILLFIVVGALIISKNVLADLGVGETYGYFFNQSHVYGYDNEGCRGCVLPKRYNGRTVAIPDGVNSVSSLINFLKSDYNGSTKNMVAFIVDTMRANASRSTTITNSDWSDLENRLSQSNISINWSTYHIANMNTYQQATNSTRSTSANDVSWSTQGQSGAAIVISDKRNGEALYALFRDCANPDGGLKGIEPIEQDVNTSLSSLVPSIETSFGSGQIMEGGNAVNYVTGKAKANGDTTYRLLKEGSRPVGNMSGKYDTLDSPQNYFSNWQISKVIYGPNDDSYNNFGSVNQNNGQNPCSYYGGKSCQSFSSGSGSTLSSGSTFTKTVDNVSIDDLQSGSKVCYGMSVYNSGSKYDSRYYGRQINQTWIPTYTTYPIYSTDKKGNPIVTGSYTVQTGVMETGWDVLSPSSTLPNGQWAHSNLSCVVIGKKPKIQVQGGDLSTGRSTTSTSVNVDTLTSEKNNTLYGSWAEYAMYIAGKVDGMASGNYLRNGEAISGLSNNQKNMIVNNISICQYSPLTFSNLALLSSATSSSIRTASCDDSVSPGMKAGYALSTASPDVSASFAATNNVGGGVDLNSLSSGVYNAGNISVSGSNIPTGKSIIIKSTGKVTITGDIKTQLDNVSSIDQISQIIIIANEIDIDEGVQRVDSWLVAKTSGETGILNTCDKYASSADSVSQLNANDCSKQLTINGPVAADKVYFFRTAGSEADSDSNISAEIFNLPATTFLWSKAREKGSASGSESTVTTVYQTEKPVRY